MPARKADVDCILMANTFAEVLRFTFCPIICVCGGGRGGHSKWYKERQRECSSKNMSVNSHYDFKDLPRGENYNIAVELLSIY